ncbi:MAG: hypothetical protein ABSG01_08345 [Anaerolineales bacterium]|jgi:hypothetical protein
MNKTTFATTGKIGTSQRRIIRGQKVSALHPLESRKTTQDMELIKMDKLIAWLERFK